MRIQSDLSRPKIHHGLGQNCFSLEIDLCNLIGRCITIWRCCVLLWPFCDNDLWINIHFVLLWEIFKYSFLYLVYRITTKLFVNYCIWMRQFNPRSNNWFKKYKTWYMNFNCIWYNNLRGVSIMMVSKQSDAMLRSMRQISNKGRTTQ